MITLTASRNKKILAVVVVAALVFVLVWLYGHSRIVLSVNEPTSGGITYTIRDIKSGKTKVINSDARNVSTIVKRGNYEVVISGSSGSHLAYTPKTPRFLGAYSIDAKLTGESSRTFVGDSPRACFGYTGSLLISGDCGGAFSELLVHQPATSDLSSNTVWGPNKLYGLNTTLLQIDKQLFAVTKTIKSGADIDNPINNVFTYSLLGFNDKFEISEQVNLEGLDGSRDYFFEQVKSGGFIAYNTTNNKIYRYDNSGSLLANVAPESPKTKNLGLTAVSVLNDATFASLYSSPIDTPGAKPTSELTITTGGSTNHFVYIDKSYTDINACGTNKLCLLGGDIGVDIYDVAGPEPNYIYSIPDVSRIDTDSSNHLLAVTKKGVYNIDVDQMNGYIGYSFSGYKFNGISKYSSGYLLALTGADNRSVALLFDPAKPDKDGIDKKLLGLEKTPGVSFININGKYIYISADLGEMEYSPELKSYTYGDARKKMAGAMINAMIDKLGIDRSKYVITSNAF